MKTSLIAAGALLVAGVGSAALVYSNRPGTQPAGPESLTQTMSAASGNPLLAFVPDDTVFFSGGLSPFPYARMAAFTPGLSGQMLTDQDRTDYEQFLTDNGSPGMKMLAGLLLELLSADDLQDIPARMGLDEAFNIAFYAVGAAPVLRLELKDSAAFAAFIDALEQRLDLTPAPGSQGSLSYRRYSLLQGSDTHGPWYLSIADNNGVASLFLESRELGGEQIASLALGLEQPEQSLAGSNRLADMARDQGFLPDLLGYVDHRELVRALTEPEGNRLGGVITAMQAMDDSQDWSLLDTLRSEACRKDLSGIAEDWPRTSMGYTQLRFSEPAVVDASMVIESRDQQTMTGLAGLRGHMPAHLAGQTATSAFGLAIGLNAAALPSFIQQTWLRLVSADYSCGSLQELQMALGEMDPAMLGLVTGMISGVKGLSASIQTLEFGQAGSDGMPEIKDLSALVTVSSDNAHGNLAMLGLMLPWLGQVNVPADGTPVPLMLPMDDMPRINGKPLMPMLAIRGSHITLFAGESARAVALGLDQDALQANGFVSMDFDYGFYGSMLDSLMIFTPFDDPEEQAQFADLARILADSGLRTRMGLDFSDRGIILRSRLSH